MPPRSRHPYDPDWDHDDIGQQVWWAGRPGGRPDSDTLPICRECGGSAPAGQHMVPGEPVRDYYTEYLAWWYQQHPKEVDEEVDAW